MMILGIEVKVSQELADGEFVFYANGKPIAGGNVNDNTEWQLDKRESLATASTLCEMSPGAVLAFTHRGDQPSTWVH